MTQKTLQVFYQCELPDVWLVLTMRKGGKPRPGVAPPVENDGASDDRILRMQQLARMCWNTFTLFHGDTKSLMARQGPQGRDGWDGVRGALREFMPRYLPGIRLDRPGDVLMALGGMHFLPVDKQSYLRIQLMINALEMRFRTIVGTVFLYVTTRRNSHHSLISKKVLTDACACRTETLSPLAWRWNRRG